MSKGNEPTDEQIIAVYEILPLGTKRLAAEAILTTGDGLAAQALAASLSDEAMLAELIKRGRLKATVTTPADDARDRGARGEVSS